jgi:hypothetical protein
MTETDEVEKQLESIAWGRYRWIPGDPAEIQKSFRMEILDGLMLSDGCLTMEPKSKNARLSLCCKHESFANIVREKLDIFAWAEPYSIQRKPDARTGNIYTSHYARSKTSEILTEEYRRWYPNRKKTVPRDLVLSDRCLLWWYIGDGHLCRKKSRPNYRRIEFATEGFSVEDVDFLVEQLSKRFGTDSVYKERNEIMIGRQSLCKLIRFLGTESPIPEYQYKFDFGPYMDMNYWKKSFVDRPLKYMNEYRKRNRVRELNYKTKEEIDHGK